MGSFGDYLESLKYTVDYIQAKAQDEFANSVFEQMQRTGISKEDLIAETLMRDEFIDDVLGGNTTEPLLNIEDICVIACTFNCDVKIELVPKPIPGKNYTLPDDLNADGTPKNKPLPNEQNADGTVKNAVIRALTEPDLEAQIEAEKDYLFCG